MDSPLPFSPCSIRPREELRRDPHTAAAAKAALWSASTGRAMGGATFPCFECLERIIRSDLSADLVFRYGVSDSALPFGSTAVVQSYLNQGTENTAGEEVSSQIVLVAISNDDKKFLDANFGRNYLDNDFTDGKEEMSLSEQDHCQAELDAAILSDGVPFSSGDDSLWSGEGLVARNIEGSTTISYKQETCLRVIAALGPFACVHRGSSATIKDLICKYTSELTEDFVISSLNLLMEGKLTGGYGTDLLKLVGFPAFSKSTIPASVRHPNISPVLGVLKTPAYDYLLHAKAPYTLESVLHYSPRALKSDWNIRFLIYQVLSALAYMHGLGVAHGNICPSTIQLTDSCWSWLSISDMHLLKGCLSLKEPACLRACCCMENCPCQAIYADLKLSMSMDWHSDFKRWWKGELSNYEYLLVLNRLAGRRWGDHTFHTVMPWIIDFSVKPDENSDAGWRDLKKSKWRLAKGDEQLDFTYSTSEIPHHVSDECLSELAVCSYKARRLPLRILRSAVRSVYEPNEYPSNMQRLYQWTPDECIPEFYSDPRIFSSIHSEMSDLAVPSWAASPEEFISLHRAALESVRVSQEIHHWIDITFGYKLSGQASITAKNVMLPASDPLMPKSMGRRQLFMKPHPKRRGTIPHPHYHSHEESCSKYQVHGNDNEKNSSMSSDNTGQLHLTSQDHFPSGTGFLEDLEEATLFCEHARYLNPSYSYVENFVQNFSPVEVPLNEPSKMENLKSPSSAPSMPSDFSLSCLLECFEADDSGSMGFQEFLHWRQKASSSGVSSEDLAEDIFSVGCILAELYLRRPLFDPISLAAYKQNGILPGTVQELPPHVALLVEASIQRDWKRRPSAKCFLESQYFPPTVRSAYLFLSPLQLVTKTGHRLLYAAKLASEGALKAMGRYAAEMCAPYCLPLITSPLLDVETESALCLLKEFLKCLSIQAIKALILPIIQKILQVSEYSHLKVSLLQDSFVRDLWNRLGKQAYLEKLHPLVISSLCNSPNKISASAAAVLLIGSSEELGVPITVQQTILPLIHSFGKGLCTDGIDALMNKPEPVQSWNALTLIDSFSTLDGLVLVLPVEIILKELIQDKICLHVKALMQTHMDLSVIQVAATTLIAVCQRIGPEYTSVCVMPQLKELFDELAFSQAATYGTGPDGRDSKVSQLKIGEKFQIETRRDLILLLYPPIASLIGIENLRKCCPTWFLLEQILHKIYKWKWESFGETCRSGGEILNSQRLAFGKISSSEYNPAKLLLNGVGWSIPQSQGVKTGMSVINPRLVNEHQQTAKVNNSVTSNLGSHEPWFWFPSPDASWDVPDFLGRSGGLKDELPWKIKASILYSARAHPGALRSLAVCHDECTVYTGGVGPGFKGSVQKWELPRMNCISGYYGHDEVVNAICILSVSGRIASCDGTIHIWNGQTGKLIAAYAESSTNFPLSMSAKVNAEQPNMLTPNALSGGILSNAFSGSLYTCMNHIEIDDKLIAGMGNGSVRFIDVVQDRKLHLWKSDVTEYSFSSLVSAICSCGSEKLQAERAVASPSWIASGLSSGHCRLLDARSGNIIALWRAHDGYITKLASLEDHLLVSSSLDKTLRVWDLRRNLASQLNVFRGHSDGISSFSIWGQDILSVSRNKIALTSLSRSTAEQGGQHWLSPQKLYSADKGMRNLSVLSTISVLPLSRLFLVGTEDGYLKICC
uniref:Protein GFS12 isoform X3 n=1 Tax=Elaeis guineensis var. tenera TaxID=51953 RepID=A0A8N4I776_ELAGV|nr:protein GFS12 isoform X3 [Elaeis guineensis]